LNIRRPDFRVIAEGDDAVGDCLTLVEAIAVLDLARQQGKRYVAIVDERTGSLLDEDLARRWVERG
jgi:hypothetical protein